MQKNICHNISESWILDWVLRTDANLDGDSLSYMDMLERNSAEERRRERERTMMEEGKALWKIKMDEEREMELRSQQQVTTFSFTFCTCVLQPSLRVHDAMSLGIHLLNINCLLFLQSVPTSNALRPEPPPWVQPTSEAIQKAPQTRSLVSSHFWCPLRDNPNPMLR